MSSSMAQLTRRSTALALDEDQLKQLSLQVQREQELEKERSQDSMYSLETTPTKKSSLEPSMRKYPSKLQSQDKLSTMSAQLGFTSSSETIADDVGADQPMGSINWDYRRSSDIRDMYLKVGKRKEADDGTLTPVMPTDVTDICRSKTCLDSRIRLPPIKRTKSENLAWDIRGLCAQQISERKPSTAVQVVNSTRKERHNNIIKELTLRMDDLNETVEQYIRKQAENIVSNINTIKDSVEQILDHIREKRSMSLTRSLILRMEDIMKQLNENRLYKIDTFCDYVRNLEKQRLGQFKVLLKKAYKDMHENMYLMPYEIQKFFEKTIQHLNQISLNNYHCYTELEKKLKLQMEEELRMWFQTIRLFHDLEASKVGKKKRSSQESVDSLMKETSNVYGNVKTDLFAKLEAAREALNTLKRIASDLKYQKYNPHYLEIFQNFFEEIENGISSLINAGLIDHSGLRLDSQVILDLSLMHCIDEEELQKLWTSGIQSMLRSLDDNVKSFLYSTAVFNFYHERFEELKLVYGQQLFLLEAKNDKSTTKINNSLNLLVDNLRQDATVDNLNRTLEQIKNILWDIDTLMESHLKEEIATVDKFSQFCLVNVDILEDEIGRFIKQFVPPPDADPRIMKKRASWMDLNELKTNDHLYSKEYLNCKFIIQGIDNWQFGVWQALITTKENAKKIITNIVKTWADKEKDVLTNRFELKTKMNNIRIQEIIEDFWKVRYTELGVHHDRFEEHELAIREKVHELNKLKKGMEQAYQTFAGESYSRKIQDIMNAHHKVDKKRHVYGIINKLWYLQSTITWEFEQRYKTFATTYYGVLTDIRNSHLYFMKTIRFFSEDGNFVADEVKHFSKRLVKLEKLLSKEFGNNRNMEKQFYDKFKEACNSKVTAPLIILNKSIAEFTFKEKIETSIKKFHTEMRDCVYDFRTEMRKFDAKIKNFIDSSYSNEHLGSHDWLVWFAKCYKEMLSQVERLNRKLAYEESMILGEKFLRNTLDESQLSVSLSSNTKKSNADVDALSEKIRKPEHHKRLTRDGVIPLKIKSYLHDLYPKHPQDDHSFLSQLHTKTFTSFYDIEEMAKAFYEKHGDVKVHHRIPSDFKSFIEEILPKYKFYKLQLEFTWLECANEFNKLVSNFQNFLDNFYKDSIGKYIEVRKEKLVEQYEDIIRGLRGNLESVEEFYISIHDKLKPMFGNPKMSNTLDIMEKYMDKAADFSERVLLDNLEPNKETIRTYCIGTEAILLDMKNIFSCINDDNTTPTIKLNLEKKLIDKTEKMQKMLSLEDENSMEEVDESSVEFNVKKRLTEYKKQAKIPPEVIISYTSLLDCSNTETNLKTAVDIKKIIKTNLDDCESYAANIESFRAKCDAIHFKYQKMWEQDINRIRQLYELKYDIQYTE